MKSHIKKFETHEEYETFIESTNYVKPNVSYIVDDDEFIYSPDNDKCLTFIAIEPNSSIKMTKFVTGSSFTIADANLEYSINYGVTWQSYSLDTVINLSNIGDSVKFRGTNTTFGAGYDGADDRAHHRFEMTGKLKCKGDITSLINGVGGDVALTGTFTFFRLFEQCTSLLNTPDFPSTTLAIHCYRHMFLNCSSLVEISELPATTLKDYCYQWMYQGCSSLTYACELPATTLASCCYYNMFYGCTSLTTAPVLPATTLKSYCYFAMFQGCTSLATAPVLPATTLVQYCYYSMFQGCTSLTIAPELPATTLANYCYSYMFYGCIGFTTLPVNALPATTLKTQCYNQMFRGCTNLTRPPKLPATTSVSKCYYYMFYGCSKLESIWCLLLTLNTTNCGGWLGAVKSGGTFYKNPSATWQTKDSSGEGYITPGNNTVPSSWLESTETPLNYV